MAVSPTPLRDRLKTEQKLIAALGKVLARDGFERCGVNAVARQAGVDKVLIYRYFEGMPGLLEAYAQSTDFWPSEAEILGPDNAVLHLPPGERLEAIAGAVLRALQQRPATQAILAWELVQRNPLTETLARAREQWGQSLAARATADLGANREASVVLANLIIAGLQYLLLRSRKSSDPQDEQALFGGLALSSESGWQAILQAIRLLGRCLASSPDQGLAPNPPEAP